MKYDYLMIGSVLAPRFFLNVVIQLVVLNLLFQIAHTIGMPFYNGLAFAYLISILYLFGIVLELIDIANKK